MILNSATARNGRASYFALQKAPRARIYAPVGPRRDLLAYLVRRLLENAAGFCASPEWTIPAPTKCWRPTRLLQSEINSPRIREFHYRRKFTARKNSRGMDLSDPTELNAMQFRPRFFSAEKIRASRLSTREKRSADFAVRFSIARQLADQIVAAKSARTRISKARAMTNS